MAEYTYRGRSLKELREMSHEEFARLLPSRQRRTVQRGFSDQQKILLQKLQKKDNLRTHCRDMIILPAMVGKTLRVHNGKEYLPLSIQEFMIGHCLGEFIFTRKRVQHNAPGIGATRSSASVSVR